MRLNLTQQAGFSLKKSFSLIAPENEQKINMFSLVEFLKEHGVMWGNEEAKLLINEYDRQPRDQALDLQEFSEIILPYYYEQTRPSPMKREEELDEATETARKQAIGFQVSRLLETSYLHIMKRNQLILGKLEGVKSQDLLELILGKQNEGFMAVSDLEKFLQKWKYITPANSRQYQELMQAIMRKLDRDKDQLICLKEFDFFLRNSVTQLLKNANKEENKSPSHPRSF
mmetsp:Transcript_44146/g.42877  ORF Transcript_44146/g.42877 Transcript_44146/m.42877 type:complete len:229 (-) Transcript_44146:1106-1792(-)